MAVMTSPAIDSIPLEKGASYPSTDDMTLGSETNGVHDGLFDEPAPHSAGDVAPPTETNAQLQPTVNGNHELSDAAHADEAITGMTNGIDSTAQNISDAQMDMNSLFDGSDDIGATSIPSAIEAPTSDVREEAASEPAPHTSDVVTETPASRESTQQIPETQLPTQDEHVDDAMPVDAMDISEVDQAPRDPSAPPPDPAPTKPMSDLSIHAQKSPVSPSQPVVAHSPVNGDQEMADAPPSGKVRVREEDDDGDAREVKRAKTGSDNGGEADFKVPSAPSQTEQRNGHASTQPQPPAQTPTAASPDLSQIQLAVDYEKWPETEMTHQQSRFLVERIRNTKKIKSSTAFREPVDPDALGIPTYRTIVTQPMDLSTMEQKLKEGKYRRVYNFMEDLDLVIHNSFLFNGNDHPVTQAGYNMRAYFLKGMFRLPRGEGDGPVRPVKPKKIGVATVSKVRRDSKPISAARSPTVPTPSATSPQAAWPLTSDGVPLIRRDSSSINDRPKREIHRPAPKDLPYNNAMPKKKKYQQELRFCEGIVAEIMKPKHASFAFPFLAPVDPVALNIPSYLKIIKKPMDFGTIEKNLKAGQYQSAKDFYNDAQLVFQNCYKFNPEGDAVHRMGKQLNELFDSLWAEKAEWLATHAPASDPQSPGSGYSDEEEEEEEEEEVNQAQIMAIQRQIQELNQAAQSLLQKQNKGAKRASPVPAKKKSAKPVAPKKKHKDLTVPPPPKPNNRSKPKNRGVAPLSFAQKQEISDGISTLGDAEMRKAVQIIKNGCPHLASTNDDEMEIDMDEIGDDTLRELFKFIKSVRAPKGAVPDDDFEPPRPTHKAAAPPKPKKNKPMGKQEQEANIKKIQDQLRRFEQGGGAASGSSQSPPANNDDDSSDDDQSSGSESEEE